MANMTQPTAITIPTVKDNMNRALKNTPYNDSQLIDGLYNLFGGGSERLHTCAICTALVAMSPNPPGFVAPLMDNGLNRNPLSIVPPGSGIYPPQIAILLKPIDQVDIAKLNDIEKYVIKSKWKSVTHDSTNTLRLVTHVELTAHIEQFNFNKKWVYITGKMKRVQGIHMQAKSTMIRYLHSFLTLVNWLNTTDKLCPDGNFTVNLSSWGSGGVFYENYFYVGEDVDDDKVTRKNLFEHNFNVAMNTAHGYLGKQNLRQLIGQEKSITNLLNIGCAKSFAEITKGAIRKKSVLVIGAVDYLSDYCMERLEVMSVKLNERLKDDAGGVYTISSEPIANACNANFKKHATHAEKNLFLGLNSSILFPHIADRFGDSVVFKEIYVDHLLDDATANRRKETMIDLFKQMIPELYEARLVVDDAYVCIPFTTKTIYALSASWHKLKEYTTVDFVNKQEGCEWWTASKDKSLQTFRKNHAKNNDRKKINDKYGTSLDSITGFLESTVSIMTAMAGTKRKRGDKNEGEDEKNLKSIEEAHKAWKRCDEKIVAGYGWIKLQFTKENGQKNHIIKYPFSTVAKEAEESGEEDTAPQLDLRCELRNFAALDIFMKENNCPPIVLTFLDGSTTSVKRIKFSENLILDGTANPPVPPAAGTRKNDAAAALAVAAKDSGDDAAKAADGIPITPEKDHNGNANLNGSATSDGTETTESDNNTLSGKSIHLPDGSAGNGDISLIGGSSNGTTHTASIFNNCGQQ